MLAQELTAVVEAKVQERVADFLALKSKLVKLRYATDFMLRDRAQTLYNTQLGLEVELNDVLQRIENIKGGAFTMGDISTIGAFAIKMERQIGDVNKLEKEVGGATQAGAASPIVLGVLVIGGLAVMTYMKGWR